MITIERSFKNINIKLEGIFAGEDLCVLITGGNRAHIGAVSIYSKEEGIKTIFLKTHKDYIIGEIFIDSIKDIFNGSISVSTGIHIDNISKEQIDYIYIICNDIFDEVKEKLTNWINEVEQ